MSEQLATHAVLTTRFRELDAKVAEALGSPLLAQREREILRVIAGHKGAANAVTAREVAERAGLRWTEQSRRKITSTVETCVRLLRIPIGGSRLKPYGYFLIVTDHDLAQATQPLTSELYALLRRLRALASREEAARMVGQAMLQLDEENAA